MGSTSLKKSSTELRVFHLKNNNGMSLSLTNFGGKIMSLVVPDNQGRAGDVVLGYDSAQEYIHGNPYFGATIGRYAGRVAFGKFSLGEESHSLTINNSLHTLHGGPRGFHNVFWTESPRLTTPRSLQLEYLSRDGEEGYPGNLLVKVRYSLTDNNELILFYEATTDKATILNLTHHSYFNLAGAGNGDILNHELLIDSDFFIPVDGGLIPTGEVRNIEGTPFDFRKSHRIGRDILEENEQLKLGMGFDHTWILNRNPSLPQAPLSPSLAARVSEPTSGRILEVLTTEPGLHLYTGNFLDGSDIGKGGKIYAFRGGLCLETQHFPDTPNQKRFPTVVLNPGEIYSQQTIFKFSAK
jgi:aldose 1-epimerase